MELQKILDYLIEKDNELRESGYIPTIRLLIEKIQEEINEKDKFDLDVAESKTNDNKKYV
jgi:hypothetical protein